MTNSSPHRAARPRLTLPGRAALNASFWAIVDANWTPAEILALVLWTKKVETRLVAMREATAREGITT